MSSVFHGLRRDLIWLWLGYLGRSLAYLGMVYILTDLLGPSGYGELALFLGLTLGVSQIAGSWPFLSVPVLAAHGKTLSSVYRAAVKIGALCTIAALAVAIPIGFALRTDDGMQVWAVAVYAVALVGMQSAYGVFQAVGRMHLIAVTQTLERGFTLIALIVIGSAVTIGVADAEILIALTGLAVTVGTLGYLIRRYGLLRTGASSSDAGIETGVKEVMATVGPMAIVSACSYGVAWIDVFMISAFEPADQVGIYTLAYQIFTFTAQIGSLWAAATLPRHARLSAEGHELGDQLKPRALAMGGAVWSGLMAIAAALAAILVEPVFGSEFDEAVAPLMVLLASAGLVAAYYVATPALIAAGRARFMAKISLTGLSVNVLLNLALIPTIGPIGAALATAIQSLAVSVGVLWTSIGLRNCLRVLGAAVPGVLGICLLAVWPDEAWAWAVCAIAGLVVLVSVGRPALADLRGPGADPEIPGELE